MLVPALRMWGPSLLAESPGAPHAASGERASFLGRCFNTQPVAFGTPFRRYPQTFLPASLFLLHPLNLDSEVPSQRAAHLTEWPALACPRSPSALPLPRRWAAGARGPAHGPTPACRKHEPRWLRSRKPGQTPHTRFRCPLFASRKKGFLISKFNRTVLNAVKTQAVPSGDPAIRVTVLLFEKK